MFDIRCVDVAVWKFDFQMLIFGISLVNLIWLNLRCDSWILILQIGLFTFVYLKLDPYNSNTVSLIHWDQILSGPISKFNSWNWSWEILKINLWILIFYLMIEYLIVKTSFSKYHVWYDRYVFCDFTASDWNKMKPAGHRHSSTWVPLGSFLEFDFFYLSVQLRVYSLVWVSKLRSKSSSLRLDSWNWNCETQCPKTTHIEYLTFKLSSRYLICEVRLSNVIVEAELQTFDYEFYFEMHFSSL